MGRRASLVSVALVAGVARLDVSVNVTFPDQVAFLVRVGCAALLVRGGLVAFLVRVAFPFAFPFAFAVRLAYLVRAALPFAFLVGVDLIVRGQPELSPARDQIAARQAAWMRRSRTCTFPGVREAPSYVGDCPPPATAVWMARRIGPCGMWSV